MLERLRQLARSRKLSINKLMEELSIAVLVAVAFPWMLMLLTVA
ncbi:MAG: hypothetical protein ACREV3_00760 [Gammaproteobacteria bacterium]